MRVESLKPGQIVGYTDLETLASQNALTLDDILDEQLNTKGGFRFEDIDLDLPNLFPYAKALARILHDTEPPYEASITTQRALGFSIYISQLLCELPMWSVSSSDFKDMEDEVELYDYIQLAPSEYLRNRPTLDTLSGRYLPEISPDPHYHNGAALAIGLTFLQVDKGLFDKFENECVAAEAKDLDNWNGEFPSV